jgi:hypothetical protein
VSAGAATGPLRRPAATEHEPYFGGYIAKVPDGDLLLTLAEQARETAALLAPLDAAAQRPYAPGKWSVCQVLGHLIDSERIFTTRALRFARGDRTPLPGFDQGPYAEAAGSDSRGLPALLEEFAAVRASTLALLRGLDDAALSRGHGRRQADQRPRAGLVVRRRRAPPPARAARTLPARAQAGLNGNAAGAQPQAAGARRATVAVTRSRCMRRL